MSEILRITALADALCERYATHNPFEIAEEDGVLLRFCPEFQTLRGMYKVILGQRFVFLNGNMKRREARQVLAHELGHDALHREMARDTIVQDHFLLDMTLRPEYEANLFAANLLYSDESILSLLSEGKSVSEIGSLLGAPESLLELKIRILREKGLLP